MPWEWDADRRARSTPIGQTKQEIFRILFLDRVLAFDDFGREHPLIEAIIWILEDESDSVLVLFTGPDIKIEEPEQEIFVQWTRVLDSIKVEWELLRKKATAAAMAVKGEPSENH